MHIRIYGKHIIDTKKYTLWINNTIFSYKSGVPEVGGRERLKGAGIPFFFEDIAGIEFLYYWKLF